MQKKKHLETTRMEIKKTATAHQSWLWYDLNSRQITTTLTRCNRLSGKSKITSVYKAFYFLSIAENPPHGIKVCRNNYSFLNLELNMIITCFYSTTDLLCLGSFQNRLIFISALWDELPNHANQIRRVERLFLSYSLTFAKVHISWRSLL